MDGHRREGSNENLQPLHPPMPAAKIQYPPGYRFMPTDAELIMEYLLKKIKNLPIPIAEITDTYLRLVNPRVLTGSPSFFKLFFFFSKYYDCLLFYNRMFSSTLFL